MHDFIASARTDSFVSAWGPDTIDKMLGTGPEEGEPQAQTTAGLAPL